MMANDETYVNLDVGAQMLDLQNCELAEAWLDINQDASAAIYFDDDDELVVRTHDGRTQPLHSSPFTQQSDQCVLYLDDAHTHGTDIKFPIKFRVAVTLRPKVTKDGLVQGAYQLYFSCCGLTMLLARRLHADAEACPWSCYHVLRTSRGRQAYPFRHRSPARRRTTQK
jgi:hypothetical protein